MEKIIYYETVEEINKRYRKLAGQDAIVVMPQTGNYNVRYEVLFEIPFKQPEKPQDSIKPRKE